MQSNSDNKETYHHGDLRRALIKIALRQVQRGGAASFSLREAAREAGVTSGAVYRHFPDKDALLRHVALKGFQRLARRMEKATEGLEGGGRLLATGQTYIAFASLEPMLFRLMFSSTGIGPRPHGAARSDSEPEGALDSFQQLRAALADFQRISPAEVDETLLALAWSVAHGAASLIADGVWQLGDPRAEAALKSFLTLLAAAPNPATGPRQQLILQPER
jgi:AcrR family transcriptional regulator